MSHPLTVTIWAEQTRMIVVLKVQPCFCCCCCCFHTRAQKTGAFLIWVISTDQLRFRCLPYLCYVPLKGNLHPSQELTLISNMSEDRMSCRSATEDKWYLRSCPSVVSRPFFHWLTVGDDPEPSPRDTNYSFYSLEEQPASLFSRVSKIRVSMLEI